MLAVFMIVTLAAIGLYLVTVSTGQVQAVTQDEQATRAYQAARAGLERGIYARLIGSTCAVPPIVFPTSPPNNGLSGFRADVTCTLISTETEGGVAISFYAITSLACNTGASACTPSPATPPSATYVERMLSATVTQTP